MRSRLGDPTPERGQAQAPLPAHRERLGGARRRPFGTGRDDARPRAQAGSVVKGPPPRLARALIRALVPSDFQDAVPAISTRSGLEGRDVARALLAPGRRFYRRPCRPRLAPPRCRPRPARPRGDGLMSTLVQDLAYGLRLMAPRAGLHPRRRLDPRPRHRRERGDLQRGERPLLKSLPYADPERVAFVMAWDAQRRDLRMNLPLADVTDIAAQAPAFGAGGRLRILEREPHRERDAGTGAGLSRDRTDLRAPPACPRSWDAGSRGERRRRGRRMSPCSATACGSGASPAVRPSSDRRFSLDGRRHTVVGVMPRRFEFPSSLRGRPLVAVESGPRGRVSPDFDRVRRTASTPASPTRRRRPRSTRSCAGSEATSPERHRGLGGHAVEMRALSRTSSCPSRSCSWPRSASCCSWPARTSRTSC